MRLTDVWRSLGLRWPGHVPQIPDPLWSSVTAAQPYLRPLSIQELAVLRRLSARFLADKEFTGAQGLLVTDEMALTVATQACLPWIHWGDAGLEWYRDFVGIVMHPDVVVARRETVDGAGVVHRYRESLAGEAMHGGPVMLVWSQVVNDTESTGTGRNLVIHEFAHTIDMRYKSRFEEANGCPRLPSGFMGMGRAEAAARWQHTWAHAFEHFRQQVDLAERFGAPMPWLDAYGASSPAEFFAVTCEAYTVERVRFGQEFPELLPLMDAFFRHPLGRFSASATP